MPPTPPDPNPTGIDDPRPGTRPLDATALGALGIELLVATPHRVVAHMPCSIAARAGTQLVLAETVASVAASLAAGPEFRAFGAELNAAMIAPPAASGPVTATATPIVIGATRHVWRVQIVDHIGTATLDGRCTLGIVSAHGS